MKIFGKPTARSIYIMFFILSILNLLHFMWSLFTANDKVWEYFFKCIITLFIGLFIWGATNPEK